MPVNVWRCPWQHRRLHHGPKEAPSVERTKAGRRVGWHTSWVPRTVPTGKPTVSSSRRSFPLRVSGDLQAGSFLGWTEGRVCACSHISFHSFTLQKAPDSVKILARSYFQIHFRSWQQHPWVPGIIYSSSLPPTSKPATKYATHISLLSTQTWCFSCFPLQMMDGSCAKYGDRGYRHILFLLNVLCIVLLPSLLHVNSLHA